MVKRELAAGTLVHKRYRVERTLGSGGFGVTYAVLDTKTGQRAAMKEYIPLDISVRMADCTVRPLQASQKQNFEKFRERFLREAQTIYNFREHPNIVQVKHLFCANDTAYYVMEYLEGVDLEKQLRRSGGKMSWQQLRPIVAQAADALSTVHRANMVHCDISPDNLLLLPDGRVKLLDFGSAREALRGTIMTQQVLAKAGFTPVEQMQSRDLGPWTDVYALAATIYYCMTGKLPPSSVDRLTNDTLNLSEALGASAPSAAWVQAMKTALEPIWRKRFARMGDFWAALNEGQPEPPNRRIEQPGPQPRQPQPQRVQTPVLACLRGTYAGRRLRVTRDLRLGTDATRCQLVYPSGSPGISRVHLQLWPHEGALMVMDMGSSCGTWLDGKRLTPGLAYRLAPGLRLNFGREETFTCAESE